MNSARSSFLPTITLLALRVMTKTSFRSARQ
jgi:hypothetical protein